MNLLEKCSEKEKQLIAKTGVELENRDYTEDELKSIGFKLQEDIMNHSTKEIPELQSNFSRIFDMIYR